MVLIIVWVHSVLAAWLSSSYSFSLNFFFHTIYFDHALPFPKLCPDPPLLPTHLASNPVFLKMHKKYTHKKKEKS